MFKKYWDLHVKCCWEEWHDEGRSGLGFLKYLSTYHVFLGMIGMATSQEHLEKLHEMLPDNVRLTTSDFRRLLHFWRFYFRDSPGQHREQLMEWLLSELSTDWKDAEPIPRKSSLNELEEFKIYRAANQWSTSCPRYVDRIRVNQSFVPPPHFSEGEKKKSNPTPTIRILDKPRRENLRCGIFLSLLFGHEVSTMLFLSMDKKCLLVLFELMEKKLTAGFAEKVIALPPYYLFRNNVTHYVHSSGCTGGCHLNLAYEFEANRLAAYFTELDKRKEMVASQELLAVISMVLQDGGIPVEAIVPEY